MCMQSWGRALQGTAQKNIAGARAHVKGGAEGGLERADEALRHGREGLREERHAADAAAVAVFLLHDGRRGRGLRAARLRAQP